MVGAGTLEVDSRVAVDESLFPGDHRVNQCSLARRPELMHLRNDPAVQATSPERHAAAGKTRKAFDILYFGRAQRGDVLVGKIALIIEGARIAKISRPFELGGEADTLAVVKDRHNSSGIGLGFFFLNCTVRTRTINAQAYARVDGFGLSRFCLDLFGFEVTGLAHFVEASRLYASVAGNRRRDLELLPIRIALNAGIQAGGGCPVRLNVKSSCKKSAPKASDQPSQDRRRAKYAADAINAATATVHQSVGRDK